MYRNNDPIENTSRLGFYLTNEIINGRIAMVALVVIILIEIFTRKTLLNLIGNFFS